MISARIFQAGIFYVRLYWILCIDWRFAKAKPPYAIFQTFDGAAWCYIGLGIGDFWHEIMLTKFSACQQVAVLILHPNGVKTDMGKYKRNLMKVLIEKTAAGFLILKTHNCRGKVHRS